MWVEIKITPCAVKEVMQGIWGWEEGKPGDDGNGGLEGVHWCKKKKGFVLQSCRQMGVHKGGLIVCIRGVIKVGIGISMWKQS